MGKAPEVANSFPIFCNHMKDPGFHTFANGVHDAQYHSDLGVISCP